MSGDAKRAHRPICENRKARHDYHILDKLEAGIALVGSEVKALRAGKGSLGDGYVRFEGGEAWLMNVHIAHYEEANRQNHETKRRRKLLLHRNEIGKWHRKVREGGLTSVPLRMYFKGSHVKVEIALVKGKANYDKRATLRDRQDKLEMDRAMRNQNKD